MQRVLTSVTLVALLVATAAAFAITERLKLTKSALMPGTKVSKAFSPTCGCARSRGNIRIVLRRADTITVSIVDARGNEVVELAHGRYPRGEAKFAWTGVTAAHDRAPDGAYRVRVHLAQQHQTIVLPNQMQLDTKPPQVVSVAQNRYLFSPDGDKQADFVRFSYVLSKPAHIVVFLDGRRVLKTLRHTQKGGVSTQAIAHDLLSRPGRYTLELGAVDLAGNSTPVDQRWRVHVRVRYIELANSRIVVRAGKRFEIGVSTDAVRYRWKLGARAGRNGGAVLRLTAPKKPGRYTLTVSERGHLDRARVVVEK
ncbi:MAG TPA: FlgD immunoglobulin-like domain containing protein [Gaiellaceae bacterium]|nr:FlgD immunoglobulin-like domain containing protein [Gaiellaceae bacterium]